MAQQSQAATCAYDTGTAGSGPAECGQAAGFLWTDPDLGKRPVCGRHARSVRSKFLPGGGSLEVLKENHG